MNAFLWLLGGKRIVARAQFATAFLDLCLCHGISYADFSYDETGAVFVSCSGDTLKRLKRLCGEEGIEIEIAKSFGFPYFCYRHRKRAGIFLGTLLSVALVRSVMELARISRVTLNGGRLEFFTEKLEMEVLGELFAKYKGRLYGSSVGGAALIMRLSAGEDAISALEELLCEYYRIKNQGD